MELNSLLKKFKGKSSNIITFILIGILLLIIVIPVKNGKDYVSSDKISKDVYGYENTDGQNEDDIGRYTSCAAYYEERLKSILEKSYGEGSMEVMVSLKKNENTDNSYYGDNSYNNDFCVDGVLIVADINNSEDAANISFAVCSLFNLPAHKVAVLIGK